MIVLMVIWNKIIFNFIIIVYSAQVAQLVEHWAAMLEAVSSTLTVPTLRVLK